MNQFSLEKVTKKNRHKIKNNDKKIGYSCLMRLLDSEVRIQKNNGFGLFGWLVLRIVHLELLTYF